MDNLTMTFRHNRGMMTVLEDLHFHLEASEFVTILGRSGSGKSTLLDLIMGLIKPTAGTIVRRPGLTIGYVFQKPALLPWRTVLHNVSLPLEIAGRPRKECNERAQEALRQVGMDHANYGYPFQLSGGMAQRVAIARALVQNPDILLMDEPFAALDPMLRDNLNVNLLKLWHRTGKTILFVTHSINEAVFLSDRIVILEEGRMITERKIPIPRPRDFDTFGSELFVHTVGEIRKVMPIQPNLPREPL
ncbi:MAG: ABC transporter ATP-binding protein [Acidobacteriota bacterium]|nr:ABC transporter ATP-binding protein [Acidobacteriota bacterium]